MGAIAKTKPELLRTKEHFMDLDKLYLLLLVWWFEPIFTTAPTPSKNTA